LPTDSSIDILTETVIGGVSGIFGSDIFFLRAPYLLIEVAINSATIMSRIPVDGGTIDRNKKITIENNYFCLKRTITFLEKTVKTDYRLLLDIFSNLT
jgi:hypothetical protein